MKKIKESIVLKSIFGIVVMLVIFSVSVSIIGYKGFTDALLKQYNDGALLIAKTAAMGVDADKPDSYLKLVPVFANVIADMEIVSSI